MSNKPPDVRSQELLDELDRMENTFGSDRASWPAGQRERAGRLETALRRASFELDVAATREERAEMIRNAVGNPANRENGFGSGGAVTRAADPWRDLDETFLHVESPTGMVSRAHTVLEWTSGLSDASRGMLANTIDGEGGMAAAFVVARSNPAYERAFAKILRNPERAMHTLTAEESAAVAAVEVCRSVLTTDVSTGGYTIPLALDPNLAAIVNNGAASPFRAACDVRTTISSPARAITSTGITGAWLAEATAVADATPTFANTDIPLFKLTAWATASYEVIQDSGTDLPGTLGVLIADARNRAEATVFATGDGTTQPLGLVGQVSAVTASRVATTTAGSFTTASAVDVFNVFGALPARARQSPKAVWFANVAIENIIRQMSPNGAGSNFWGTMGESAPDTLLGKPFREASGMVATTTSGSYMLIGGDGGTYRIVDHIVGPSLEFLPYLFDQATGRPNYTRGWLYHQRTGAKCLDPSQWRVLKA